MQYKFNYPYIRDLRDKRLYSEIITSLYIMDSDKNIKKCNVKVTIHKRISKTNGKIYSRSYYSQAELKFIINKITNLSIINWEFIEKTTINQSEIQIDILTLGDLECQHLMLKKKLKNIISQMKNLSQCGKRLKMQ